MKKTPTAGPIRDHEADPWEPRSVDRGARTRGQWIFCFRAGCIRRRICRRGSTPRWRIAGSHRPASTIPHMGTHTMRRTKVSLIYRRTKNLRALQLLLGHTKLESTVRYLGIEVDDALEMAEQTEV